MWLSSDCEVNGLPGQVKGIIYQTCTVCYFKYLPNNFISGLIGYIGNPDTSKNKKKNKIKLEPKKETL